MVTETIYFDSDELYQVIARLYLQLDKLIVSLAPEGWDNSPYHFPFELIVDERETLHSNYLLIANAYERRFGRCPRGYLESAVKTVDAICKAHHYNTSSGEMIYLIEYALVRLTQDGLFTKASDPSNYYTIDEFDVEEQSYIVAMDMTRLDIAYPSMQPMSTARRDLLQHLDLSVIYAAILEAFATLNYYWRYCNQSLQYYWISSKIAGTLNHSEGRNCQQAHLDKLNQLMTAMEQTAPPDQVLGYLIVYDKLPVGYPPTLDDIKQIKI